MIVLGFASCSSSQRVVSTMNDSSRPSWAREDVGSFEEDDQIHFIGVFEIKKSESLNMNSVKKASEMKAWDEISKKVSTQYESETTLVSTGMNSEEEISEKSKLVTNNILKNTGVSGRWFQVREESINDLEISNVQYFTKISIKRSQFDGLIRNVKFKK
jgi:hypothetical protein